MITRRFFLNGVKNYTSWSSIKPVQSPLMKMLMSEFDYYTPKIIDNALDKIPFISTEELRNRVKKVNAKIESLRAYVLSKIFDIIIFTVEKSSEYYTIGRNPVQGEFTVFAYEALNDGKKVTDEVIHQLKIILATVEIINSYFFIYDDLEDDAKLRVGRTCWHLVDNNGVLAFNDACIMRSFVDEIVRQNFKGELCENILKIYQKTTVLNHLIAVFLRLSVALPDNYKIKYSLQIYFMCSLGQYVQATVSRSKNYDNFTNKTYEIINRLKSATYSVKMPIFLGLALNNKLNQESQKIVDDVAIDIGIVVQVHNDLLDYYHTKGIAKGKTGNDIQEGNCSWIAIAILERCNPEQRRIFNENYGSWDPEKVKRIHQLYDEINVDQIYEQEKKRRIDRFKKKVNALPENCTPSAEFFKSFYSLFNSYSEDTKNLMYDKL